MDNNKQLLKGSPSRDTFKQMHKTLAGRFYACDIDFVLVENRPPYIIAFLDFKLPYDSVTFAEVLAYNTLSMVAPVYIVESPNPEMGPFSIRRYLNGVIKTYPTKPHITLGNAETYHDWEALGEWEAKLRKQRIGKATI